MEKITNVFKAASATLVLAAFAALPTLTAPAMAQGAQPTCGPTAEIASRFMARFGERPAVSATMDDGSQFQIWIDPNDESWTAFAITPDGRVACLLSAGTGYVFNRDMLMGAPA